MSITFLFREHALRFLKIMKAAYLHCKANPTTCPLGQSCLPYSLWTCESLAKAAGRNPSSHKISAAQVSETISPGKNSAGLAPPCLVWDGHTYSALATSVMCFIRQRSLKLTLAVFQYSLWASAPIYTLETPDQLQFINRKRFYSYM